MQFRDISTFSCLKFRLFEIKGVPLPSIKHNLPFSRRSAASLQRNVKGLPPDESAQTLFDLLNTTIGPCGRFHEDSFKCSRLLTLPLFFLSDIAVLDFSLSAVINFTNLSLKRCFCEICFGGWLIVNFARSHFVSADLTSVLCMIQFCRTSRI